RPAGGHRPTRPRPFDRRGSARHGSGASGSRADVVIDPAPIDDEPTPPRKVVGRRVDRAGRISILKHRYHVGRYLAGRTVEVESVDGLLQVSHQGVLLATHARQHLAEDDERMDRKTKASRPSRPTKG